MLPCPASLWASLAQWCTVVSLVRSAEERSSLLHSQQKSTRCPPTAARATVGSMCSKGNGNLWATLPQGRFLMILQEKDQSLFASPHKATVVSSIPSRKILKREHLGISTEYTFCDRHSSVTYGRHKEKYTWSCFQDHDPKGTFPQIDIQKWAEEKVKPVFHWSRQTIWTASKRVCHLLILKLSSRNIKTWFTIKVKQNNIPKKLHIFRTNLSLYPIWVYVLVRDLNFHKKLLVLSLTYPVVKMYLLALIQWHRTPVLQALVREHNSGSLQQNQAKLG